MNSLGHDFNFGNYGYVDTNDAVQQLTNVGFAQSKEVVNLFLFKPRRIHNTIKRSHHYSFGMDFRNAFQEKLARSMNTSENYLASIMPGVAAARGAVLPSATGVELNTSVFSDMWTFILIIDNDRKNTPMGLQNSIPTRMLYSGWIISEPVTPMAGHVDQWAYNPNAVFVTTHHTTLMVQRYMSQAGENNHINTSGDYDYLPGMIAQQLTPPQNSMFDLQPGAVYNGIVLSSDPNNPFNTTGSPIATAQDSIEISTDLNNPSFHLGKIVTSMVDAVKSTSTDTRMQHNTLDAMQGGELFHQNFGVFLQSTPRNVDITTFDPKKQFMFQELEMKYGPILNVMVDKTPYGNYDVDLGGSVPSKKNVMTSILSSSIPQLLAQFGLAEIGFRYSSVGVPMGHMQMSDGVGALQILSSASLYGVTQNSLHNNIDSFFRYLKLTVFPIIQQLAGEFDLQLYCTLCGVSLINLHLLDELIPSTFQETNNLLGGLNSPLFGVNKEVDNNSGQLYGIMCDTIAPVSSIQHAYSSFPTDNLLPTY